MYTSIIYGLLVDYVISNTDYCPGYIIDQWSMRALQQGDGGICPPHFKISLPPPTFTTTFILIGWSLLHT